MYIVHQSNSNLTKVVEVLPPVPVALDDSGDIHLGELRLEILEGEDSLRHPLPSHRQGVLLSHQPRVTTGHCTGHSPQDLSPAPRSDSAQNASLQA